MSKWQMKILKLFFIKSSERKNNRDSLRNKSSRRAHNNWDRSRIFKRNVYEMMNKGISTNQMHSRQN